VSIRYIGIIAGGLVLLGGGICGVGSATSRDSGVRGVDQEVLTIDKHLADFTKSSQQACDAGVCATKIFYWGPDGRIRKMTDDSFGPVGSRRSAAHFYSHCRLILTRVTPAESGAPKKLSDVEKYYFRKGKLIRVIFGDELQTFGKDQMAYYQRTMDVEPVTCTER
jgi:hypothetical protein